MAPEAKNIVICCDGTGNEFSDCNSNVVKLYTALRLDDKDQVAYYHPGLGTMGVPDHTSWVGKKASQFAGLAFGVGLLTHISEAYKYLMEQYKQDDKIFLFGFSRGAYTVRALAGALNMYGLLCPGNEGHLPYLLRRYANASRKAYHRCKTQIETDPIADAFKETFSRTVPIHFLGIWDTVSSIGWIYDPVKLLFDGQNPIVRKVRHAVSIDEHRCFFQEYLMGSPLPPQKTPALKGTQQDILQVWFPGVHSDIGGSYPQNECAPSEVALRWMLDEAKQDGLLIDPYKWEAVLGDDPDAPPTPLKKLYPHASNSLHRLHESLTWKWTPFEIFPHRYFTSDGKKCWWFRPWRHCREIPGNSILHPSVLRHLDEDRQYHPKNLHRECISPLGSSPTGLPVQELKQRLANDGFLIYRPS